MCEMMLKGSKEALTVLIVTHVTHVKGVKRSLNSSNCYSFYSCQKITLCTQYRNIQCYVKMIHGIGWYGWKGQSLSFPKLFLD